MSAKSICPARVVLFGTVDYQAGRSSGFLCEQPQLYDDTHPGPGYPSQRLAKFHVNTRDVGAGPGFSCRKLWCHEM